MCLSGVTVRRAWHRYFEKDKGKDHKRLRWIPFPKTDDSAIKRDLKRDLKGDLKGDSKGDLKGDSKGDVKRDNDNHFLHPHPGVPFSHVHPGVPFLHVHPEVPFQQIVPERPSRFPYPPKVQYLSKNGSSVIMVATSSIPFLEAQHSLNLLEKEEARKREVIHRRFHYRLKVKHGDDGVRRRSNVVLPNSAYRNGTEPRVVARFRRVYAKSKEEGDSEPEMAPKSSISHGASTRTSTVSNDATIPLTLFAMRLERYQQLCLDACHHSVLKTPPILSEAFRAQVNTGFLRTQEQEQEPVLVSSPVPGSISSPIILVSRCQSLRIAANEVSSQRPCSSIADRCSLNPSKFKQRVRRVSQHITDDGTGVGSGLLEISRGRCNSLSQRTVGTYASIPAFLSTRWRRPLFYKKSSSPRYPQSLQTKIKIRDELSHILEEPTVVLDVNDTTALRAACIDPEEAHPNPEAFFERQFAHFQEHGCFLQDDLVQPEQGEIEVVVETIIIPESEPVELLLDPTPVNCLTTDGQEESIWASSRLRRAVSAIGGYWRRSKGFANGLIRKTKNKYQSAPLVGSTKQDKVVKTEEEVMAKKISEICFAQAAMNERSNTGQDDLAEEKGDWIQRIPAGHGSIGQFECRWLDAMVDTMV